METISYKTSSPAGDLISFMAGIKQIYESTGKNGIVYQRLDMPYFDGPYPFEDDVKLKTCMGKYMFDMLRPLLLSQEYIEEFAEHKGEEIIFNLDNIRLQTYTNQPLGSLNRWPNYVFPDMSSDLSKKWINLSPIPNNPYKEKVVINFTQRYRNHIIDYRFLTPHQENIVFAGLEKERDAFCQTWDLGIKLLEVKDFLELANIINGCKFFLGNASVCFHIAEALKVPRILEICPMQPNVIPIGEHAYDFYHQIPLEYYFNKLMQ